MLTHEDWEFIAAKNQEISQLAEADDLEGLQKVIESCDWRFGLLADFDYYTSHCGGHFTPDPDVPNPVLEAIPIQGRVLDVGFGYGHLLIALQARDSGQLLCGIDSSELAVQLLQPSLPSAELRVADATRIPWPDDHFRTVVATELLEHLPPRETQLALKEMIRVGSRLVLTTRLNENLGRYLLRCPDCKSVIHPNGHVRSFSEVGLVAELKLSGWKLEAEPVREEGGIFLTCGKLS